MKILYVLGPTMMGGATISFKIILDGMIERGNRIVVLVSHQNKNQDFINYMISKGCEVAEFSGETYVYPKISFWSWNNSAIKYPLRLARKIINLKKSEREVYALIKKYTPDIVHTNIGVLRQGFYACNKLRIPHLWHIREYQTKDFGWRIFPSKAYYRKILLSANIISITNDIIDYFRLQSGERKQAWWDAVLSKSEACYRPIKENYFLCANRISPEKKVEDAISAFSLIASQLPADFRLLIVGDQHDKNYIDQISKSLAVNPFKERIEIRPHQADVTRLMENATALIVTSKFEGLGRMTLEAIFKGCLVLGRGTGGTREIVEGTGGGLLFNDIDDLSQKMLRTAAIKDSYEYRSMIKDAQQMVIDRCSSEAYNMKMFSLYQSCLTESRFYG
jgi:L-malate glycosyltransferase